MVPSPVSRRLPISLFLVLFSGEAHFYVVNHFFQHWAFPRFYTLFFGPGNARFF